MDNWVTVHEKRPGYARAAIFFRDLYSFDKKSKAQWIKGVHIFCTSYNHCVREEK